MKDKKDRYVYPALFNYADDGISVEFPDLPGCLTAGDTEEEAIAIAKEAMTLHLYGIEQDGDHIPPPSKANELYHSSDQVIILTEAWMLPFRDQVEQKAVKKKLTVPKWLDDVAREKGVNYSGVLQDTLKEYLGVDENSRS